MALIGKNNEEKIWNYLTSKGLNAYAVAGLMGNLCAESALNPQNLQNTYERKLGFTDAEYTAAVDSGSYSNFVRDSAGYGLAQWTFWSRKERLLEYVKAAGASIGDLEAQLGFLYKELSDNYTAVLAALKKATSVRQASDVVLTKYERPADQSESVQIKRANYGQKYFDRYAGAKTAEKEKDSHNTGAAKSKLTVDGKWGAATTKRLQQIFGTPVDGKVSNQWAVYKKDNPGLLSGWDWQTKPSGKGSALIKAMQKWAGMASSAQDGEWGPATCKAIQKKLGTPVDGKVSNPSQMIKALQKWANEQ